MKALALVEAPDHVCCRYRVRAFEPTLAASGWTLTVQGLAQGPAGRWAQLRRAGEFDAVVLQRKLLPAWQLHTLRRATRRLIFDYDDAVLYRDSYDPRGPHCPRRASRFARTVRLADVVLAGNGFLADCARKAGARAERVRVLPTCVDPELYRPKGEPTTKGPVQLVWIGSSSTLQGLERQRPLLERLGLEVPGLQLRLICDRFPRFDPLPVLSIPWSEPGEADAIAGGDLGITWVPDDLWSRGKCGLKVLQYQAAGLPVVANPVGVHPLLVQHGVNGLLADTPDEWVRAIQALTVDPSLRSRLGREARTSVEVHYSVATWAPAFVAALTGASPPTAPKTSSRNKTLARTNGTQ
ncbi:MAG: glycosyltransferase family 4 protein [Isosphaeraceae bacterium]